MRRVAVGNTKARGAAIDTLTRQDTGTRQHIHTGTRQRYWNKTGYRNKYREKTDAGSRENVRTEQDRLLEQGIMYSQEKGKVLKQDITCIEEQTGY
jgi:hypothetical protein